METKGRLQVQSWLRDLADRLEIADDQRPNLFFEIRDGDDQITLKDLTLSLPGMHIASIDLCLTFATSTTRTGLLAPMDTFGGSATESDAGRWILRLAYRRAKGDDHEPCPNDLIDEEVRREISQLFKEFCNLCIGSALTEHLNRLEGLLLIDESCAPRGFILPDMHGDLIGFTRSIKPLVSPNLLLVLMKALQRVPDESLGLALVQSMRLTVDHADKFWRAQEYGYIMRAVAQAYSKPTDE